MKKIFIILGIVILLLVGIISALATTQIFFDDLETANFATIWTNDASNKFTRSGTAVYTGAFSITADGGTLGANLTLTTGLNITNQTSCNLSSVIQIHSNLDGGEYICMDYSLNGGTTWNRNQGTDGVVGGLCQDGNLDTESVWKNVSVNLQNINGTTSFKIKFRISTNNANEDAYIDNVNLTCERNLPPEISNITASNDIIKGGNIITFYANTTPNRVLDEENQTLYLYCDTTNTPTSANTDCTGGITTDTTAPYVLSCSFTTATTNLNYTEYCRVYDGKSYSSAVNATYQTDSNSPTTSIVSVAGDTIASYYDTADDSLTEILVLGESGMACRWSSSDLTYSGMTNNCPVTGTQANCSVTNALTQGFLTRYISCQDNLTNEQNSSNNLDVQFYLDYTAPTTSDNSTSATVAPTYVVKITENDNVDADPTSYYCTSSSAGCSVINSIDNGGTITYTSANRGANYLRYYSIDFAGNNQTVVNKTININQLPVFISAQDNANTIKGGKEVNVSVISYDLDSGQEIKLYVCKSESVSASGCGGTHYCNTTGSGNMSCVFNSETDSSSHIWYAFLYDELDEMAVANYSGSYITDITSPLIIIVSPTNTTYTQDSVTFTIAVNEALSNAWYSLKGNANVSMANSSLLVYSHSNSSIGDGGYSVEFWANDSYGNIATSSISFGINTIVPDTTPPTITVISPANNSYNTDGVVLLNISSNEVLSWAGYSNNSNEIYNLANASASSTTWNITLTLAEGQHNITFYANDSALNQATASTRVYVDLTNPAVSSFSCSPNPANDSLNVNCSASVSDSIGLNYAIISYNETGIWQNSSHLNLTGTDIASYIINSANTTPGQFKAEIYVYDLSGRTNMLESTLVNVSDDKFPDFYNFTYSPNTTDKLDPAVKIDINITVVEDYYMGDVYFMYSNLTSGIWKFINMSNLTARISNSAIIYNVSFSPGNETWYIKINATDSAGNMNISSNRTLVVTNEISQNITSTIPSISSIILSERANNNSLGWINMTNTGDDVLSINISFSSSELNNRLFINRTTQTSANYTGLNSGDSINITIEANTSGLNTGFYNYSIIIKSDIETITYSNQINIQNVAGPVLDVIIDEYSSTVTRGQTDLNLVAKVTNLGTTEASDVSLTWNLPSAFSLSSGSLSRYFSNIPVGISYTNTISVDISSSATESSVNISATGNSSNADSDIQSKAVTITNPLTVTQTITTTGGGGGGGGGAKAETASYSKEIEIVRGGEDKFDVEISNKYSNATLEDLTLNITGFLKDYITISPSKISKIMPGQKAKFSVTLKVPAYKEAYEEYIMKAIIKGTFVTGANQKRTYQETQNIKLIIEQISKQESEAILAEAEEAIKNMEKLGYNTDEIKIKLEEAKLKLADKRNKEATDLSNLIVSEKNKAIEANELIKNLQEVLNNPRKIKLITGNVAKEIIDENENKIKVNSFITGNAILNSKSSKEMIELAVAAFARGDYTTALERAKYAQVLLVLERKGNFLLFIYLYWYWILPSIILISGILILSLRKYRKNSAINKIIYLNKEERNISKLIEESQKKYYAGKISSIIHHKNIAQYQKKMAEIKQERITLRNKRISLLKPEQIEKELKLEKKQIENEIKDLQTAFYKERKIPEQEYKIQFQMLNERLAEVEEENITLRIMDEKKSLKHEEEK